MGFFDAKKKSGDNFRTLSEKDIQQKLYGHLRQNHKAVQEDLPSYARPIQEAQKSAVSLKTIPSVPKSSDLFISQENDAALLSEPRKVVSEPRPASLASSAPAKAYIEKSTKVVPPSHPSKPILENVVQILKTALFKLAEVLGFLITGVLRIIASIDFRKPAIRKAFYTVAGIAFLMFVLFSIHMLNVQREEAMKNPAKKPRALKKVEKAQEPESTSLTVSNEIQSKAASSTEAPQKETAKQAVPATSLSNQALSPSSPALSVSQGNYVIQVATFATKIDAQNLAGRFKEAELSAFVKPLSRSGGRVYYCVFIGRFQTQQQAEEKLSIFKKKEVSKPFQDAFVRSL